MTGEILLLLIFIQNCSSAEKQQSFFQCLKFLYVDAAVQLFLFDFFNAGLVIHPPHALNLLFRKLQVFFLKLFSIVQINRADLVIFKRLSMKNFFAF